MSDKNLYRWEKEIARRFEGMSRPHVKVLALISYGVVLAKSCGLTAVSSLLGKLLKVNETTMRQRMREFYVEAEAKRGKKRKEVEEERWFGDLMKWVMSLWEGTEVALAMDATSLGQVFTVLTVSVVIKGCAIPVGWKVVGGVAKGAWRPHWERLLRHLKPGIPKSKRVIVLADRGLYAKWLYDLIVELKWHPFLRINLGGNYRPEGHFHFRSLREAAPQVGSRWSGQATVFSTKSSQLTCTLLACWEDGYTDPWLIVTDLAPDLAHPGWYGMRTWIERSFKLIKSGGWNWQHTKMTDPNRASRLWLVIAVATLWVVSVGDEFSAPEATSVPDLTLLFPGVKPSSPRSRPRLVSLFRAGLITILTSLLSGRSLPIGRLLRPDPWPTQLPSHARVKSLAIPSQPLEQAA
jgi:hypothetical protein